MLEITKHVSIPLREIELSAVRASGPGGQHVNKVSSAIHLRFNIPGSSLPENIKQRLLQLRDRRLTRDGVVIIKAQRYRDQEKNRGDALQRLQALIRKALHRPKQRVPTRPSRTSRKQRMDSKSRRGRLKAMRGRVIERD